MYSWKLPEKIDQVVSFGGGLGLRIQEMEEVAILE